MGSLLGKAATIAFRATPPAMHAALKIGASISVRSASDITSKKRSDVRKLFDAPPPYSFMKSTGTPVPENTLALCAQQFGLNPNNPALIVPQKSGAPGIIHQLQHTIIRGGDIQPSTTEIRPKLNIVFGDSGLGGLIFAIQQMESIKGPLLRLIQKYDIEGIISKHIGDTLNAPYGVRSKEELAILALNGTLMAKIEGANYYVKACNTASTVIPEVVIKTFQSIINNTDPIIQIIDHSAETLYQAGKVKTNPTTGEQEIHLMVLATPFVTNKSKVYNQKLHEIHQAKYPGGTPKLVLHEIGPENWVRNIETGVDTNAQHKDVKNVIDTYMESIPAEQRGMISAVGLYCTHFPFYTIQIRDALTTYSPHFQDVPYVEQGKIFGDKLLEDITREITAGHIKPRETPLTIEEATERFDGKIRSLSTFDNRKQTQAALVTLGLTHAVSDLSLYSNPVP